MSGFTSTVAFSQLARAINQAYNTSPCPPPVAASSCVNPLQDAPTFGDKNEMQEPLKVLQKLCDFPVLHFNFHVERTSDGNPENFVATLSDKEPTLDESFVATYPTDTVRVDIAVVRVSEQSLKNLDFWGNIFCSILTFRGHEVFYNGKLYNPFTR
jgi:hypothetical protein